MVGEWDRTLNPLGRLVLILLEFLHDVRAGVAIALLHAFRHCVAKTKIGQVRHFLACLPQRAQHKSVRLTAPAGAGTIYRAMQSYL